MKLYRFSPIMDKEHLLGAIKYVVKRTAELCKKTINTSLPISSLTIFTHYPDECEGLVKILNKLGSPYNFLN